MPYLALFLINRFVLLPLLLFRKRSWLFFISNLALILVLSVGVRFYRTRILVPAMQEHRREVLAPPPGAPPPRKANPPRQGTLGTQPPAPGLPPRVLPPFVSFMLISVLMIGFDTGLVLSVKWAQSEQHRISMEKENIENQLAFLRNQISPHFFMNTLNNIHALIDINTTEAKESVIKLSRLMRHLLYDSDTELIPLKKESEFIQNYVELMRLRYSDKVQINLQLPDEMPDKSIPPLLFTSFVENAFKHGISYLEASFISISFAVKRGRLVFEVRNSHSRPQKEAGISGIGLENSRKRLDLLYGNRYSLDIHDGKEEFSVKLSIPL